MPGRQSHGRSLMGGGGGGGSGAGPKRRQQKQKSKAKSRAQDAFSIANKELGGDRHKLTPRNRELDADLSTGKRRRGHADDDEDDEDEDGESDEDDGPPRKRGRAGQDQNGDDVEYGSDSSGNEWRIGVGDDDDDSDIDSDEAFGESDDEKFQGYSFGGSQKKGKKSKKQDDDDDEEDEDDDLESLGSDAIDLADALDMSMSDDDDQGDAEEDEDSDEDDSGSEESEESDESEDDVSESGVKDWVNKFSGVAEDEDDENTGPQKSKIDLQDLGLLGGLDPSLKKSLKLMSKEEKSSKPQKLEVPLARRQQARLDRAAAYEQANKTLDRWNETVKQNRRADHLVFPLAQTETGLVRHDNTEIAPLDSKTPGNELEQTIMGLVEASGFAPKSEEEPKEYVDENGEPITRKQYWALKRKERELKSREEARAKRIKKIKSKAYHRVHRKEREKNEIKEHEALAAAGLVDSEDEREQRDRQRAAERMGSRHKDSKWAKMARKGGLAVWDDSVREGMNDMARRDEELRRRVEGRGDGSDDDSDYSGDSEDADDRKRLLKELQRIDEDDEPSGPKSKLMNMPFMKKAENARKKENDDLIKQIRRELLSDDDVSEPEPEADDIGRRQFGAPGAKESGVKEPVASKPRKEKSKRDTTDIPMVDAAESTVNNAKALPVSTSWQEVEDETAGAWSSAVPSKPARKARKDKAHDSSANVLDLDSSAAVVKAAEPALRSKSAKKHATALADDSSDDEDHHLVQFRDQDLLDKAFGGLDVVAEFEAEKHAQEEEDDEKVIDNTLPGWGSWVGDGVSAREKKRHQGRFLTKQEGIKKDKRKDAKLKNVIMNEKIIKKNNKYMASQLPHTFENSAQYERSLRLPVGPEWVTKKTHQDAVKPKVIIKQGIIAPMAKPLH
ncbi:hypothetical protein PFICI_10260 [Pestalotiopsis fici W106-1]|uniref:Uncharacterized protein n=1 Tax=Pestalotiopsis fici (strain W106-1 / CGMCC3.15140) TaxID=1229662 RepID=W3WWE0_PESFW|nr:uncharacterized protein PFICI_10260 [Pestalotiopsis fici W106-1]ETS78198.1 hypothetical protein PFICI_10260 [Pestalotiopsis fici W106-1]